MPESLVDETTFASLDVLADARPIWPGSRVPDAIVGRAVESKVGDELRRSRTVPAIPRFHVADDIGTLGTNRRPRRSSAGIRLK